MGCLVYTGKLNNHGYGVISVNQRTKMVHRLMYENEIGPIPGGLVLDHLCYNPPCSETSHLEPVTQAENTRRAKARRKEMADA
jgi:hypothetical protein